MMQIKLDKKVSCYDIILLFDVCFDDIKVPKSTYGIRFADSVCSVYDFCVADFANVIIACGPSLNSKSRIERFGRKPCFCRYTW